MESAKPRLLSYTRVNPFVRGGKLAQGHISRIGILNSVTGGDDVTSDTIYIGLGSHLNKVEAYSFDAAVKDLRISRGKMSSRLYRLLLRTH